MYGIHCVFGRKSGRAVFLEESWVSESTTSVSLASCTTVHDFPHTRAPFLLARHKIREIRRATGYGISIEKPWRPEKGPPDPLANCTTVLPFPTDVALAVGGPAQRHTIRCRNLSPRRSREQRPGPQSQNLKVKTLRFKACTWPGAVPNLRGQR